MGELKEAAVKAVELRDASAPADDMAVACKSLRAAANDFAAENARNMEIGEFSEDDRHAAAVHMANLLKGRTEGERSHRPRSTLLESTLTLPCRPQSVREVRPSIPSRTIE